MLSRFALHAMHQHDRPGAGLAGDEPSGQRRARGRRDSHHLSAEISRRRPDHGRRGHRQEETEADDRSHEEQRAEEERDGGEPEPRRHARDPTGHGRWMQRHHPDTLARDRGATMTRVAARYGCAPS